MDACSNNSPEAFEEFNSVFVTNFSTSSPIETLPVDSGEALDRSARWILYYYDSDLFPSAEALREIDDANRR